MKRKTVVEDQTGRAIPGDDASPEETMRAISRMAPRPTRTTPAQTDVSAAPTDATTPKRGAWVWKTNAALHTTETVWDPKAEPVQAKPLSISRSDMQLLIAIAKRLRVPVSRLNGIDPAAVREARAHAAAAPEFASKFEKYESLIEALR